MPLTLKELQNRAGGCFITEIHGLKKESDARQLLNYLKKHLECSGTIRIDNTQHIIQLKANKGDVIKKLEQA